MTLTVLSPGRYADPQNERYSSGAEWGDQTRACHAPPLSQRSPVVCPTPAAPMSEVLASEPESPTENDELGSGDTLPSDFPVDEFYTFFNPEYGNRGHGAPLATRDQ